MGGTAVFDWEEVTVVGDGKLDRRVIAGEAGELKRVVVPAGTAAARHSHAFEQFFMVLSGGGVLRFAEGETVLKPGVVVHFEAEAWHEAVFEEETVLVEVNFREGEVKRRTLDKRVAEPRSVVCEISYGDGIWDEISIDVALKIRDSGATNFTIRCQECHGQVRAHKEGAGGAHFEHLQGHAGCSKGNYYDGQGSRLHPSAIT